MNWLDFYKEFYFQELERKYSLMRSMSVPIGIATLLSSGLLVLTGRLDRITGIVDLALLLLLCCTALLLLLAIYFMKCAYFNHAYHYLPTTLQIATHQKNLQHYYIGQQEDPDEQEQALQLAERETISFLTEAFAESAHHNTLVNDKRSRLLFWANASLSGALLLLVLAGVATVFNTILIAA